MEMITYSMDFKAATNKKRLGENLPQLVIFNKKYYYEKKST